MSIWLRRFRRRVLGNANARLSRRRPAVEPLEDRCVPAGGITEFSTGITAGSGPTYITRGADGNLWFTEFNNNAVARITPGGSVTEFSLAALNPTGSNPDGITSGPNGLLYFTENGVDRIGSINPLAGSDALILTSLMQSAVVPSGNGSGGAGLEGITAGPNGNLWFTESAASRVGNVNTSLTTINEFSNGISAGSAPAGIALGPDGNLWFTESAATATPNNGPTVPKIGRITTGGTITEFPLSVNSSQQAPNGITAGPFGTLWFTETGSDQIGRITTGGTITEFPRLPTSSGSAPLGITLGPDGNLWFTESDMNANNIGRITPTGAVTEYAVPTANSTPTGITTGPDGNLWFTENTGNQVAKLVPDAPLSATGVSANATATVAFSGTVANFSDGSASAVPGDFTITINWGDGTTTGGTAVPVPNQPGSFSVSGTHTFAAAGTDNVTVTITDKMTNSTGDVGGNTATANSTITVALVGTTTTLTATPSSVRVDQPVTLTATVTPNAGSTVPTGTVTFFSGSTPVGSAALDGSGKAVLVTALPGGNAPLTAVYGGSSAAAGSTSAPVAESVNPDVTALFTIRVLRAFRSGRHFHLQLALINKSGVVVPGPLFLVLRGLPGSRLLNKSGVTAQLAPAGTPLFLVATGPLAPGQSRPVNLIFAGTTQPVFTPLILANTLQL